MRNTIRTGGWITAAVIAALILGASASRNAPVAGDREDDAAAIRAHIDSIFQAYMNRDRETIRATHSEDWRGFLSSSRSILRGIDDYMQAAEGSLTRPRRMVGYEMVEYDTYFHGDLAVVPYVAALEIEMGGRRIAYRPKLRVFDLYAKRDGHWIQVGSDTAPHPETQEARRRLAWPINPATRKQILADREAVWRAWFEGDLAELERLVPEETIAIGAVREPWSDRDDVLAASRAFAEAGGKLSALEFPQTEIQLFGDVAVVYTSYSFTVEIEGEVDTTSGRGTEIFVFRGDRWVNPGWHLDLGIPGAKATPEPS